MEETLHYVWKHRLFDNNLQTTDGKEIEVIDTGLHNMDSGPDFFNAKIKIDGQMWSGNIEIHIKSSDWERHRHQHDKAYNSVILHVVEKMDREIFDSDNRAIYQCELSFPKRIKENIDYFIHAPVDLPCTNEIRDLPAIYLSGWINTLLVERLERKSNDIKLLLERFNNSWDDVFYTLLCRNFGFGLNSDSFQMLAQSLPLKYILKQGDNILQIEAMLLGHAGILSDWEVEDEYVLRLKNEYDFLRHKFSLIPLEKSIFKNMRIRPTSSPQLRIAQLASILQNNFQSLFSRIVEAKDLGQIRLLLHQNASDYWQTHYVLGKASDKKSKYIGDSSLDIILINTVVPILFAYGRFIYDETYCDRALLYLEQIKAESNSIVKKFGSCGLLANSAYDSQAIIQMKKEYCDKRKCLFCRIGYQILVKK